MNIGTTATAAFLDAEERRNRIAAMIRRMEREGTLEFWRFAALYTLNAGYGQRITTLTFPG